MANFDSKNSPLLVVPDGVYTDVRKIYNLHKPGRLDESVHILSEWVKKQAHFSKKDYPQHYLERILIQCKGSVEKAKKQMDSLATTRILLPKYFTLTHVNQLGADLPRVLQSVIIVILPELTPDLHRVGVVKLLKKHTDSEMLMLIYQIFIMVYEYALAHDYSNGYIIIFDFQDTSIMDIITKLKIVEFHQFVTILLNGYGARVKAIYDLTDSAAINTLKKLMKPILSEKIYNRINIVPKIEDLQKHIPKEILPIEYGGNGKSLHTLWDEWIQEISSPEHHEYLNMMKKAGTDENLRASCDFNNDVLGMPGCFRNLSLD